jgi:hypothetical protein
MTHALVTQHEPKRARLQTLNVQHIQHIQGDLWPLVLMYCSIDSLACLAQTSSDFSAEKDIIAELFKAWRAAEFRGLDASQPSWTLESVSPSWIRSIHEVHCLCSLHAYPHIHAHAYDHMAASLYVLLCVSVGPATAAYSPPDHGGLEGLGRSGGSR